MSKSGAPTPSGPHTVAWQALGLFLAATVLISFRLHAFGLPLENDECNYAYIGKRILEGDRLYVDVWDHQPPGVFVLYAAVIKLFGDSPHVFRWMTAGVALSCLLLIFLIVRRVAGEFPAIFAALLYAVVSSDPGTAGEGCNREIYLNALVLLGWYGTMRGVASRRYGWIALAGAALGAASTIKTIVAVPWLALAGWIGWTLWRDALPHALKLVWYSVLAFALPPLLIWASVFAYFGATGRWPVFLEAVFLFNLSYSGGGEPFLDRFFHFFAPPGHRGVFDSALPLWVAGAVSTLWLLVVAVYRRDRHAALLVLLALSAFAAVCLPGRFWPHYYHLLIPPLVIATASACRVRGRGPARSGGMSFRDGRGTDQRVSESRATTAGESTTLEQAIVSSESRLMLWLRIAVMGGVMVLTLAEEYRHYLCQPPFGITVHRYNSRDFWGKAQGENVRRVTDPTDAIFVFSNDAEIYYYAQRRCASRFTMITGLQAAYAGAEGRRRILLTELRANPPRLILLLFDEPPFDEWRSFLAENYGEPVGVDYHDRTGAPIMFVLARKDAPLPPLDWNWDRSEVGGWFPGERPPRR